MQKEIPLLFSTMMVQALLAGRKTMTRRTVKMTKDDIKEAKWGYTCFTPDRHISFRGKHASGEYGESFIKCPYGKKGDILWVRETTTVLEPEHCMGGVDSRFVYKANVDSESEEIRQEYIKIGYPYQWKPSIFMKKEAARIWLEVESIRVERLQNITDSDSISEGVTPHRAVLGQDIDIDGDWWAGGPYNQFRRLWQKINGAESWAANPWVWVVSFKVLSTTGKPNSLLTTHNSR